jgi:Uma2 family endonuclease
MADGGYKVKRNRLIPDIGFVSKARYLEAVEQGYQIIAPDLAIEVLSPSDKGKQVQKKIVAYLEGDTVVWLVNPKDETIIVYHPDKLPQTLHRGDTLDGGDVLVGFSLALDDLFDL